MRSEDLKAAYTLLSNFKSGGIERGSEMTDEQIDLLLLLCQDLLPNEKASIERLSELLPQLARTDTHWNRKTQQAIDEFYALQEGGQNTDAEQCRQAFLDECPSAWYRGIVESL